MRRDQNETERGMFAVFILQGLIAGGGQMINEDMEDRRVARSVRLADKLSVELAKEKS